MAFFGIDARTEVCIILKLGQSLANKLSELGSRSTTLKYTRSYFLDYEKNLVLQNPPLPLYNI